MAFWSWSKTAATNASADTSINWAEGQAPSSVNDSARAMMARLAEYRDDVGGALVSTGTGAAYVLATNQVFTTSALMDRKVIAFYCHATNTGAATLNVDGIGAKALYLLPGVDLVSGMLISGTPYVATYYDSASAFHLHGTINNPYNIPVGGILPYAGSTAPNSSFAIALGQAVSRTTYATLFAIIGTTYGVGDGSTTFNLPDFGGRTIVGKEVTATRLTTAGGGVDGGTLGAVGGAQNGTVLQANLPAATLTTTVTDPGHVHAFGQTVRLFGSTGTGGGLVTIQVGNGTDGSVTIASATTGITASTALGGSGTAFKLVQPTIVCNYIVRVI